LYHSQLLKTTIRLEDIPEEVLSEEINERAFENAVSYALDKVEVVYKKDAANGVQLIYKENIRQEEDSVDSYGYYKGDDEECSYNSNDSNEGWNEDLKLERRDNSDMVMGEIKSFLMCLQTNVVYDMGFRCKNQNLRLCWCPW